LTWKEQNWINDSLESLLLILMLLLVGAAFSPLDVGMVLRAFDGTAAEDDPSTPAE